MHRFHMDSTVILHYSADLYKFGIYKFLPTHQYVGLSLETKLAKGWGPGTKRCQVQVYFSFILLVVTC